MTENTQGERVEMPYKVRVWSNHAAVTVRRNGSWSKTTNRYFATKEEATKFCGGDERKVIYAPNEAFCCVTAAIAAAKVQS